MDVNEKYEIKDISLADQGKKNLEWAELQMGALMKVKERFEHEKPLQGLKIGMALHITKETGVLVRTLSAGGAEVAICSCNPLSTQDDIAAALATEGFKVFGWKGENEEEYYRCLNNVINFYPNITVDDGCDLVSEIHKNHPDMIEQMVAGTHHGLPHGIIAGAEETTTGIVRLRAMVKGGALKYPIIAVNESNTKHLMDNYLGTGQSTLDGIVRASNVLLTGKTLVIAGYGNCGKGVALRGQGMGCNVIVTEVDPFRALQARMEGKQVMPMAEAAKIGDIFITVTGDKHVIRPEHFNLMKSGVIVANSGHFDTEIDVKGLDEMSKEKVEVRPLFDRYTLEDGRWIFVCGEGRLVNLACAEGHPSTVMDLSFCNQSLGIEWVYKNREGLSVDLHTLPEGVDEHIASLKLEALGTKIDTLTPEQVEYLNSWKEGT